MGDQGLLAFHRHWLSLLANSGPASDDALLNPPDPLFKGAIRAYGLSIAACLPCSPAPARHLMMPCYFIGTLSQTISIPLTPFSRGHIRPSCAPERMATASLFFGRHLRMPWQHFGRTSSLCYAAALNPDAPRGLYVLHVFAAAYTRTRLSQSP